MRHYGIANHQESVPSWAQPYARQFCFTARQVIAMTSPSTTVIQSLANQGVEVIFSLSGNQIMPLYDACIDANIRIIHTRHEGAAVYMAEAYAQISGKIGVALVTAGPGLLNAVSALYSAARSETPLLLISGDAASRLDG